MTHGDDLNAPPDLEKAAERLCISVAEALVLFKRAQALFQDHIPTMASIAAVVAKSPPYIDFDLVRNPQQIAQLVELARHGYIKVNVHIQHTKRQLQKNRNLTLSAKKNRQVMVKPFKGARRQPRSEGHIPPGFTRDEWEGDWESD